MKKLELINFQKHNHLEIDFTQGVNVIFGSTDAGKCLSEDTLIINPETGERKQIKDLITNPFRWKVLALNSDNKLETSKIMAITANGLKEVYQLTTKSGRKIKTTFNHRFLIPEGWKELQYLKKGDFIAVPNKIKFQLSEEDLTPESSRLLGYLIGDGGTTGNICFTNAEKNLLNDFIYCLKTVCGDHLISKHKKSKAYSLYLTKPLKYKNRHIGKSGVHKFCEKYNIKGYKSKEKRIPSEMFQTSLNNIANFIGALFDCDGFVPTNARTLEYSSSSEKLIRGIQHLLLRFGINSRLIFCYKKYNNKKFPHYILFINGWKNMKLFYENIPLQGKKKQLLKKRIEQYNTIKYYINPHDNLPRFLGNIINEKCKKIKLTAKEIRKKTGLFGNKCYFINGQNKNLSRNVAEKLAILLKSSKIDKIVFNDIFWDEVKEIKSIGKKPTYDLEIEKNRNFVANDIIVHNSCIRRALSWIFFNEPKGDVVRKTGTKKTSAKVTLDNDVQVERLKSSSVNAYIVYINGEEKRFDAVGKDIPEEVLKVLKSTTINVDNDKLNLNIANQIALPFLLDKSGTFRSKLFNKLTGSDIVDKALQGLNKDILRVNRENKLEKESLEEKKIQLEELTKEKEKVESTYNKVSKIFTDLKNKQEKYDRLKEYLEKLDNVRNEIRKVDDSLKEIRLIDEQTLIKLNDSINKLNDYSQLLNRLQNNKKELENINKEISQLKIPEIDITDLKNKIERLNKLNEFRDKLEDIQISREKIVLEIVKTKAKIENGQVEYKELLKKFGKCPVCKGEITNECLEKIKL